MLFYTTDDEAAGAKVEQLIERAGFDPVRAGTISASGRIEVGGDLHPYGGLEGRVVDRSEASRWSPPPTDLPHPPAARQR